jgi:EAL domain-containing protein (putative c-di-GMP-specific phosphodiesterase class I)
MSENKNSAASNSKLRTIELLYRPVFDIHLNMAIDYETSMQINDRLMGVMLPKLFIPIAEKSNQAMQLNLWSIEEACEAMKRCEEREADINSVIIWISVKSIAKKSFVNQVKKITEKYSINPDRFCFNINESILEDVKDQILENIVELKNLGYKVSIDDFGLEYTSLTHLTHYDVDYIGLHESLLEGIMTSEKTQNMVQGIIDFCHKIEAQARVDGIDSKEMFELLKKMGADQFKGPYFGDLMNEKQIS